MRYQFVMPTHNENARNAMQNTEKASIEFEGKRIEYTVIRSARRKKTIKFELDPQQGVVVRSPVSISSDEIANMARKRAPWILRHLSKNASIEFEGRRIEYTIIRSARRKKTIQLALDPQQGVVVRSPIRVSNDEIAAFVQERARWILRKAPDNLLRPTPRRFTDGETLFYLGKEIPIITEALQDTDIGIELGSGAMLRFNAPAEVSVRLEDDAFCISVPAGISEEERICAARAALERWYRREAARMLPEAVARWQSKVSRKKPSQVLIRSQRKRWGSCSSDGIIRLNWRLIMAEPELLDYVVVHELVHLAVMNHSPRFWKRVERVLPDYRDRNKRLDELGFHFWF